MSEKGVVLEVQLSTIHMKETGETFKLKETTDGHLGFPLNKSIDNKKEEIVKKDRSFCRRISLEEDCKD